MLIYNVLYNLLDEHLHLALPNHTTLQVFRFLIPSDVILGVIKGAQLLRKTYQLGLNKHSILKFVGKYACRFF